MYELLLCQKYWKSQKFGTKVSHKLSKLNKHLLHTEGFFLKKNVSSSDLWHLAHCYMYELLLYQQYWKSQKFGTKVSHKLSKLNKHLLHTEGFFCNWCHPYDINRDPLDVLEMFLLLS